jgi:nitrous oxidase accessory protein NosD
MYNDNSNIRTYRSDTIEVIRNKVSSDAGYMGYSGIEVLWSFDILVEENHCISNNIGINVHSDCHNIQVIKNNCSLNTIGIAACETEDLFIESNALMDNTNETYFISGGMSIGDVTNIVLWSNEFVRCGLHLYNLMSATIEEWDTYSVPANNTVNGKPIYVFEHEIGQVTIPNDWGQLIFVNCSGTVINGQVASECDIPVQLVFCSDFTISNNVFDDVEYGLLAINSTDIHCEGNKLSDFMYGLHFWGCSRITATYNEFYRKDKFTLFGLSGDSELSDSIFSHNQFESILVGSNTGGERNIISNNTFIRCDFGAHFNGENQTLEYNTFEQNKDGCRFSNGKNIIGKHNTFRNNTKGLNVITQHCSITDNLFENNGIGLECTQLFRYNDIKLNTYESNEYGIWVSAYVPPDTGNNDNETPSEEPDKYDIIGNRFCDNRISNSSSHGFVFDNYKCMDNEVFHNRFIHNNAGGIQALDNGDGNLWDDAAGSGNFWSDLQEPDDNEDGIVDTHYPIDGVASSEDRYPLVLGEAIPVPVTNAEIVCNRTTAFINEPISFSIGGSSVSDGSSFSVNWDFS